MALGGFGDPQPRYASFSLRESMSLASSPAMCSTLFPEASHAGSGAAETSNLNIEDGAMENKVILLPGNQHKPANFRTDS